MKRIPAWAWWGAGALGVAGLAYAAGVPALGRGQPQGLWYRAIEMFGGRPMDPHSFSPDVTGLAAYLATTGATGWTARQLTTPNNLGQAALLGYVDANRQPQLLPPRSAWPKVAALSLLARRVTRDLIRGAEVRNVWRPGDYNERVGGVDDSAHIDGEAIDIDFDRSADRQLAQRYAVAIQRAQPWLQMGIGVGERTLHLDILTGKPQRPNTWCYSSAQDCAPWSGSSAGGK